MEMGRLFQHRKKSIATHKNQYIQKISKGKKQFKNNTRKTCCSAINR